MNQLVPFALLGAVVTCVLACSAEGAPSDPRSIPGASAGGAASSAGTNAGGMATAGTGSGTSGAAGTATATSGSGGTTGGVGTTTSAGSGGTGGSSSATGGSGGSGVVNCKAMGAEKALPMPVDGNFIASGYFAGPLQGMEPEPNIMGIVEVPCDVTPDPPTSVGTCHKFTFKAALLSAAPAGAYGGVFWQAPVNNWGTGPGNKVAPGATKVTFRAWSDVDGTVVNFNAGGIVGVCADEVQLGQQGSPMELTTEPMPGEVSLGGQTYADGVIGGFVWSTSVTDTETTATVYIDDIQWVAN